MPDLHKEVQASLIEHSIVGWGEGKVSPHPDLCEIPGSIETNIMTLGDYLEALGYKMIHARNGLESIEKAESSLPDLILMDIQMPAMDGLEATLRLRMQPRFAPSPIIANTALAMPGDREHCLQTGANEYISKPVRLKELVSLM